MTSITKKSSQRFRLSTLAQLVAATLVPTAVLAQADDPSARKDATTDNPTQLAPVVVSAQRRLQPMNDVPIAISAVGSEELSKRGVTDLQGLVGAVPSLSISGSGGLNVSNLVAIRGLSGQLVPIGSSTPVAIYVDGEYLPRPDSAFFTLDDVQRVEVLRGPQGTLYGRNSTAGAINIITRVPGDSLQGGGDVSYGNYNHRSAKGSVSGPLGGGFGASISAAFDDRDGYFTNSVTGNNMAPNRAYTVRGKLRYQSPSEDFTGLLSLDTSQTDGQQAIFQNVYGGPSGPFFALPGGPVPTYIGVQDPRVVQHDALSEQQTFLKNQSHGGGLTLTYRPNSAVELTSVTTFRDWSVDQAYDFDGTAAPLLFSRVTNSSKTFMQEFRAVIEAGSSHTTVGVNFYKEDQQVGVPPIGPPAANPPRKNPYDTSNLKAVGLFGQYEIDVTKELGISAGLRWNSETRDFVNDYTLATNGVGTPTPGPYLAGKIKDDVWIPALGFSYKLNPDAMVYGKVSKGYQAPGFNPTPGITATAPNTFAAEHLTAFELGVKSEFFNRRLSVDVAAFDYDYQDMQVRTLQSTGVINIENAGSARIRGLELSAAARLGGGFGLNGNYSWLSPKYGKFCEPIGPGSPQLNDPLCGPGVADRSGNQLINAPKQQGSVSLDYAVGLSSGTFNARLTYSYASKAYFSPVNDDIISTGGASKRVDARIGYQFIGGPEVYLYGKNLTNSWITDMGQRGGPTFALLHVSDPRTYGAGLRYRF